MSVLFNGGPLADLAQSRGLHYGDGVFRTILIWDGQLIDWDLHMQKLASDCAALDLAMPAPALLRTEALQLATQQARAVLKIMVMRQGGGRGYRSDTQAADRLLMRYPAPGFEVRCWESGIDAFSVAFRLGSQPALAGLKHLNRLEQVLTSRHWPDGADEGILCDRNDCLVSGTRSNLFWVSKGQLFTPLLDESGVSGMMRNKIINLGKVMKVAVSELKAPLSVLREADEAFVCNSLIGIWPLRCFEERRWAGPGAITVKLAHALQHPRLV